MDIWEQHAECGASKGKGPAGRQAMFNSKGLVRTLAFIPSTVP